MLLSSSCSAQFFSVSGSFFIFYPHLHSPPAPDEKSEPPQAMNALMRLNQLKPGLQYKLLSQTGPVHVPVFTMAVEVDGKSFEASGPSKRTAKLHVAVKVSGWMGVYGVSVIHVLSVWCVPMKSEDCNYCLLRFTYFPFQSSAWPNHRSSRTWASPQAWS